MQAKLRQKAGSLAGPGWGWVCNEVCDGYVSAVRKARQAAAKRGGAGQGWGWVCNEVCNGCVTRSVTRQSNAQYAKRASAAPAIQRKPSCGKKGGALARAGVGSVTRYVTTM